MYTGPPPREMMAPQVVVPAELQAQQLWRSGEQLRQHLRELVERAALLKAVAAELEAFESLGSPADVEVLSADGADVKDGEVLAMVARSDEFGLVAAVQASGRDEARAVGAAVELQRDVTSLLLPLEGALGAPVEGGWEHAAAAARLRSKREKVQRNRKWRKRKRQRVAEARRKEQEGFEEADRKVDEWRAREIAKSIAQIKMEKMKVLAEQKAKEDRARLAAELEMVLMVEKLQELRALRIQKLKKQGRFFPDEDDKFMERVRAAVEEEERQAAAAADTRATAAAIATAAEAAKGTTARQPDVEDQPENIPSEGASDAAVSADQNVVEVPTNTSSNAEEEKGTAAQEAYKLPPEFYHFYYGSQLDLGALIEVRRAWDAYLMPGGSRIPGHWVEPPPPADAVWASYLVRPPGKAEPKAKKRRRK